MKTCLTQEKFTSRHRALLCIPLSRWNTYLRFKVPYLLQLPQWEGFAMAEKVWVGPLWWMCDADSREQRSKMMFLLFGARLLVDHRYHRWRSYAKTNFKTTYERIPKTIRTTWSRIHASVITAPLCQLSHMTKSLYPIPSWMAGWCWDVSIRGDFMLLSSLSSCSWVTCRPTVTISVSNCWAWSGPKSMENQL